MLVLVEVLLQCLSVGAVVLPSAEFGRVVSTVQ